MDVLKRLSLFGALVATGFVVRWALAFAPDFLTWPLVIGGLALGAVGFRYRHRQSSPVSIKSRP